MGRFTRILFSEVRGTVRKDGKPLAGVTVRRKFDWRWGKKTGVDQTVTDSAGQFDFPQIARESVSASIPHEPVIGQFIFIDHEGEEYVAWEAFKHDYAINGELDGKPINLECELTRENGRHFHDAGEADTLRKAGSETQEIKFGSLGALRFLVAGLLFAGAAPKSVASRAAKDPCAGSANEATLLECRQTQLNRSDSELNPAILDILVDLRFRGDSTGTGRRPLLKFVVANDLAGFAEVVDATCWVQVPKDRFESAMASKKILFPNVHGVVLIGGIPVQDAEVRRW